MRKGMLRIAAADACLACALSLGLPKSQTLRLGLPKSQTLRLGLPKLNPAASVPRRAIAESPRRAMAKLLRTGVSASLRVATARGARPRRPSP